MRKILKSGAISVSGDVFRIREAAAQVASVLPVGDLPAVPDETEIGMKAAAVSEMIIQRAMEQADHIVCEAAQRAEMERAAVLQQAQLDAARLREQAVQNGEITGARNQLEAVRSCIAQLEFAVSRMEGEQAGFVAEYEQNLKWLALEIASKVLNKRIEEHDTELVDLVRGAVNSVKGADWITVQVSDTVPKLLDALADSLRVAEGSRVEFHDIPAPPGTCIVETPGNVVDASVYVQLENLKDYFQNE